MPSLLTGRRPVAGLTATALAGAALALLPAAPSQAATDLTLTWGVSQYLNEHLTSQTFTGGASEDADGFVTCTGGSGSRTDTTYAGTARYAFVNGGTEFYSISIADPEVVVDAAGEGTVRADVAWTAPATSGSAADVVLATFGSGSLSGRALTATPRWAGVAPADAYGTGKPVDGKSWAVDFVKTLPASIQATFYASGSTNDPKKAPAAFTAQTAAPSVTATVASTTAGVTLTATGERFTGVTNPGDDGVYVGLAPAGGMPDVSSMSGQSAFAAAQWVPGASIVAGAFTTSLTAAPGKLDRTRAYSLYTWRAHSHSTTSMDTETPVSIDWAAVFPTPAVAPVATPVATTVATSYKTRPSTAKRGKLAVDLGPAATGQVTVVLTKAKKTKTVRAALTGGTVVVKLPRLTKGTWTVTVSYAGDATHQASTATGTVKVKAPKKR